MKALKDGEKGGPCVQQSLDTSRGTAHTPLANKNTTEEDVKIKPTPCKGDSATCG